MCSCRAKKHLVLIVISKLGRQPVPEPWEHGCQRAELRVQLPALLPSAGLQAGARTACAEGLLGLQRGGAELQTDWSDTL